MRISRRRYEEKIAEVRWQALVDGQEQGRQEMADMACNWLGIVRARTRNPISHNAILHAQAFEEGQRLLAYFYDESSVEDIMAFSQRFFDLRKQDAGSVITFCANEISDGLSRIVITGGENEAE